MLRLALVGRNKTHKKWAGNWLEVHHNFVHKTLEDPLDQFFRDMHWWLYRHSGKQIKWWDRLSIYDQIYELEPEIWVNFLAHRLDQQRKDVVVSGVRYISELEYLRDQLGFKVVRVYSDMPKFNAMSLGKNQKGGTLYLMETYGKDFTEKIKADFTLTYSDDKREEAKQSLAQIVDKLRKVDN